jgi:pimeloyl-ACP methyl ester carboxylesterase
MPLPSIVPLVERLGRAALVRDGHRARHIATPAGDLHVYDARGHGPLATTVMLHGIGATATAYAPILRRLQRRTRRVIALEYPGHGFSGPPAKRLSPDVLFEGVTHALDELLEEPAVLCGNSLGGAVALHYAVTRPSRVRALCLVSPAGARVTDDEMNALLRSFDLATRADALEFLGRIYHRVPRWWPLLAHELLTLFARPAVRDLLETATVEHAPTAEALRALTMPILLLWGESERLLPESALTYFRANLPPHSVIERPEACGHSPHLDRPRWIGERFEQFIRELPRS